MAVLRRRIVESMDGKRRMGAGDDIVDFAPLVGEPWTLS
jgi:hypothetical protein